MLGFVGSKRPLKVLTRYQTLKNEKKSKTNSIFDNETLSCTSIVVHFSSVRFLHSYFSTYSVHLQISYRKFLKNLGVTTHKEIEKLINKKIAEQTLKNNIEGISAPFPASSLSVNSKDSLRVHGNTTMRSTKVNVFSQCVSQWKSFSSLEKFSKQRV